MPRPQPIIVSGGRTPNLTSFEANVDLKQIFEAIKGIQEMREASKLKEGEMSLADIISGMAGTKTVQEPINTGNQPVTDPISGAITMQPNIELQDVEKPNLTPEQVYTLMQHEGSKKALLGQLIGEYFPTQMQQEIQKVPTKELTDKGLEGVFGVFGPNLPLKTPETQQRGLADILQDYMGIAAKYDPKTAYEAHKALKETAKPITYAPEIETFALQKGIPLDVEGNRGKLYAYMQTEEGKKEFKKYLEEMAAAKASPYYPVIPTSEGLYQYSAKRPDEKGRIIGDKPLTGEMIESESQIGTIGKMLKNIESLYKPEHVGAIEGRIGGLKEKTIGLPEEQAQFYSNLATLKNMLIYLRTGQQLNEHEFQRLMEELPHRNLPDSVFKTRMKAFKEVYDTIITERQKAGGGYGMPKRDINQPKVKGQEKRPSLDTFWGK